MLFINNYLCGVFLRCRCLTQSQLSLQVKLSERAIYVALSFLLSAMLFTIARIQYLFLSPLS